MNEKCKTCRFCTAIKRTLLCDYLVMTGKPRGCPAGEECDKWEEKTKNKGKETWRKKK